MMTSVPFTVTSGRLKINYISNFIVYLFQISAAELE